VAKAGTPNRGNDEVQSSNEVRDSPIQRRSGKDWKEEYAVDIAEFCNALIPLTMN
jgi:hypothetical protein